MNCSDLERNALLFFAHDLDAKQSAEFLVHVSSCVECKKIFRPQQELNVLIRQTILDEKLDTSSLEQQILSKIDNLQLQQRGLRFPTVFGLAAAAAILVVVVGLALFFSITAKELRLYADASTDHHVEVVENARREWTFQPELISQLGRQATGAPTKVPLSLQGYVLTRGKICSLQNRRYLHLVYKSNQNEISLFITRSDDNLASLALLRHSTRYLSERQKNVSNVAAFREAQMLFVVASAKPDDDVAELARQAAEQLRS
ncbi:MAG: hypothetical protein JWO20_733 [Candidatus Angelobacter sp.]|nr:hypothetical protein [Candidatus Angelobacter sp.]